MPLMTPYSNSPARKSFSRIGPAVVTQSWPVATVTWRSHGEPGSEHVHPSLASSLTVYVPGVSPVIVHVPSAALTACGSESW